MTDSRGTQWSVVLSEGLDAIAFLGALSGVQLYVDEYPTENAEFSARLDPSVVRDIKELHTSAEANEIGLLWPWLALVYSGAAADTLDDVIRLTDELDARLRAPLAASEYWDEKAWDWLRSVAPTLSRVLNAMGRADFSGYRRALIADRLERRAEQLREQVTEFDVVTLQRKLSGKEMGPEVEIVLLYFCQPHGVRIQGQRFIQSADFDLMTTVRIAAHELLHPPIDMHGPVATAAVEALARDDLVSRIVRDHNPSFGYTTLDGYLNEDICQAVDQLIIEQLNLARNPADRWRDSDDGMHVLAAGLYGLLRQDRWVSEGGSIEAWLGTALEAGRLRPEVLHAVGARVLERPIDQLWPVT